MKVLVACEFSGVVRDAFRDRGHQAWSCDYLPSERGQRFHIQDDVREILRDRAWRWDLLIAHPPCTYLSNSGALRLYIGGKKRNGQDIVRWGLMKASAEFFRKLLGADIPRICVENPVMHGHGLKLVGARYAQTIQPYQFGHPESKRTCLWLKNLPPLRHTRVLKLPASGHWLNQTPSGQNRLGPSPTRAQDRSRTYEGFAEAMAVQWGSI